MYTCHLFTDPQNKIKKNGRPSFQAQMQLYTFLPRADPGISVRRAVPPVVFPSLRLFLSLSLSPPPSEVGPENQLGGPAENEFGAL